MHLTHLKKIWSHRITNLNNSDAEKIRELYEGLTIFPGTIVKWNLSEYIHIIFKRNLSKYIHTFIEQMCNIFFAVRSVFRNVTKYLKIHVEYLWGGPKYFILYGIYLELREDGGD